MLCINRKISISDTEIEISAVLAQGAGGQNVNKVSTAIHLRFDIKASTLPDSCKEKLLSFRNHRITKEGVIVIKAQRYRTQEKNKQEALRRLQELIKQAIIPKKSRRATAPTKKSKEKRLEQKKLHAKTKTLREKIKNLD